MVSRRPAGGYTQGMVRQRKPKRRKGESVMCHRIPRRTLSRLETWHRRRGGNIGYGPAVAAAAIEFVRRGLDRENDDNER